MISPGKVLIAGATGMAGIAIIKKLLEYKSNQAIRGTFLSREPFFETARVEYLKANLTIYEDCRKALTDCQSIIMAAAATGGALSARSDPARQMTENAIMDLNMLQAAHDSCVKRIIYLSSATVYQEFEGHITEDQLDLNKDPYATYFGVGWAKRSAEKFCQFWREKFDHEVVILRVANIYGPFAKFDPIRSNFIPATIRKSVDKLDPFEVWGNPEVSRDVIFTSDFAEFVVRVLFMTELRSGVFNLGSGKKTTVGEVVKLALESANHYPGKVIFLENRPTAIKVRSLDCGRIEKLTGWKPRIDISEGIRLTTEWWLQNKLRWDK